MPLVGICRCWCHRHHHRCCCQWAPAAAGGVAIVLWHLQLQVLPSLSVGTCRGMVAVVIGGGGCGGCGCGCDGGDGR